MICAFVTLLIACCSSLGSAQVQCSGAISSTTINNNVECNGDCVLDAATINGNLNCATGTLLAKGSSVITGAAIISGSVTTVDLEGVTIQGAVSVSSASSLTKITVTSAADLNSLSVTDTSGDIDVAGTITSITLTNSGDFFADGLTATGGMTVTGGNGVVDICSSTIGSLTIQEHTGAVIIDSTLAGCGASTLSTGFTATKGTGDVTVKGADLSTSDFIVSEYDGDAILQDAQVSDILISKNTGSLTITNADADSDTTITTQDGSVTLTDITTLGDFLVSDVTGNVEFKDSDFGLEDATFTLVDGTVTVTNNINLNLEVKETGGAVSITANTITDSNISKNTGGVSIVDNTFDALACADNTPAPTGSGNTVTTATGQCSSGFP